MLGYHSEFNNLKYSSLASYVKYHYDEGVKCVQICCSRNLSSLTKEELLETRKLIDEKNIKLYMHSCLTHNIASDSFYVKNSIKEELSYSNIVGSTIVSHFGSKNVRGSLVGSLDNILNTLKSFNLKVRECKKQPYSLLMENSAGEGNKFGSTIWDIGKVINNVEGVGLCLDTAHMFGSGMCEFKTIKDVKNCLYLMDCMVGKEKLKLVHLNDSKVDYRSLKDRHENIGDGKIWSSDTKTLSYLIKHCKDRDIDIILETPDPEKCYKLITALSL